MTYPIAIAIAGACFLLGCRILYFGWKVRKPNVYVHSSGASFPNLTSANKMFFYEGASVDAVYVVDSATKLPNRIVTTLEQRGGNFTPVSDAENS